MIGLPHTLDTIRRRLNYRTRSGRGKLASFGKFHLWESEMGHVGWLSITEIAACHFHVAARRKLDVAVARLRLGRGVAGWRLLGSGAERQE
jgi:hypothetical protein